MGEDGTIRGELSAARIPNYASPAEAARSLMHLAHDAEAREFLMAAPPSLPSTFTPDVATARGIVEAALAEGRTWLSPPDVCRVLAAYDIPIMATEMATSAEEAARLASPFFSGPRGIASSS
ncbi:acetate--CoA ligase family protein [Roseibium salinum]|nr:acetate--CoA ligase family protein [Roseibium salinum]